MLTPIPSSPLTDAATSLLTMTSPPHLVNHCQRTFQFGMALDSDGVDPELGYLGAALHDLGLTEAYDDGPDGFEDLGAAAAHGFLVEQGLDRTRADLVVEAIRTHLLLSTPQDPRPEVAFVARGAGLDVVGFGYDQLEPRFVAAVLTAYPRLAFKKDIAELLQDQAVRRPDSTIAQHVAAGMLDLVDATPFDS